MRITITGINSLAKVAQRGVNKDVEDKDAKKAINTTTNLVKDVSTKSIKIAKLIVDLLKNALTLLLPMIIIVDLIVFVLLVAVAGSVLILFNN
jgi:hypothetical protein